MGWNKITASADVAALKAASTERPQLIFKHSTRCGISMGALYRLEGGLETLAERFDLHFLDLLAHRPLSNQIAADFSVVHASPQVIVVEDGAATFNASHGVISPEFILSRTS